MSSGLVFIHHAPASLLAHVEWTLSGVSGSSQTVAWSRSNSNEVGFQAVASWSGPEDGGAVLAAAFMNLKQITFEVTQDSKSAGYRWSYTPALGMFQAATDAAGNLLIGENQLRSAMERAGSNPLRLQSELRKLLGQAFDDELEIYRENNLAGPEGNNSVMSSEAKRVTYSKQVRPG